MVKDQEYRPLISYPSDGLDDVSLPVKPAWTSKFTPVVFIGLLAAETLAFALYVIFTRTAHATCTVPLNSQHALYSPALEAVEHEVRVYYGGFSGDMSPFQIPSSPTLDKMWTDLYNTGLSRITKQEAARLPNKTSAIPGDDDHYIVSLDVFHSLHCLNNIRMALDPDYYPDWRISTTNSSIPLQKDATDHISHCMEWIRQAVTCSGDTSLVVWQWHDASNFSRPRANVAHTCRKFDKLQDWAKEHAMKIKYDTTVRIEDDIVVPIFHNEIV
ncbi:hypothetical protein B0H17DRAFT_1104421 [Mycena rosella]|uniref:Tat pathway signal sequence n=1 Tax=Mycena rosella TaxID=1033263 RepID=A0AAD7C9Z4_MYCRO|nr:hypothetical protein B0H17DRAFT_1104421 [Mycena rosella]